MTIRFSALTYSGATDLCIGYQLVGFAKAKPYTVGSWLEVWMENYVKIKLRPSTFKTSQGFLKNHIKPQIGSTRLPLAFTAAARLTQVVVLPTPPFWLTMAMILDTANSSFYIVSRPTPP